MARQAFADTEYQEAVELYDELLKGGTLPAQDLVFAGIANLQNNNFDEALYLYHEALRQGWIYSTEEAFDDEPLFYRLHSEPMWDTLKQTAYRMIQEDRAMAQDVRLRLIIDSLGLSRETILFEIQQESENYINLLDSLDIIDSLNTKFLTSLTDSLGWLGHSIVGKGGAMTVAKLMGEMSFECMEKYLDIFKAAVEKEEATSKDFVAYKDKILVYHKDEQIYGTQFHSGGSKLFPIEDFKNLNARRMEVGLYPFNKTFMPEIEASDELPYIQNYCK